MTLSFANGNLFGEYCLVLLRVETLCWLVVSQAPRSWVPMSPCSSARNNKSGCLLCSTFWFQVGSQRVWDPLLTSCTLWGRAWLQSSSGCSAVAPGRNDPGGTWDTYCLSLHMLLGEKGVYALSQDMQHTPAQALTACHGWCPHHACLETGLRCQTKWTMFSFLRYF